MKIIRSFLALIALMGISGTLFTEVSLSKENTIANFKIAQAYTKATSPIWQGLTAWRGGTKTNGLSGSKKRYYEWDNTHSDIEVYDSNGIHLGSADPGTGVLYKAAVNGRKITI